MSIQPVDDHDLPEVRGADALAVRASANDKRAELLRTEIATRAQLATMKAEMERQRAEIEADFRQQESELIAHMRPMLAELDRMKQVIHTVDLYLGRSEEMLLIRDGEPAGCEEQIVVRQRVLAADEESLVLIDEGGVDARRMDRFIEWIASSIENTTRVLPEPKCVVCVVPSRQSRDYKDPWLNSAMGEANSQTHWLFRNGERLWVMTTDFTAGQVITPRLDEFTSFFESHDFRGNTTGTLTPGSDAWLKAEQAAGARKRHYMKVGMILQGVLDRTDVFAPLPEGGVNILSAAQAELQQVRFINELDMVLTDGRESFRSWQRRLNGQLQPGMRIVGAFDRYTGSFHEEYLPGDRWTRGYHPRLHPGNAEYPQTGTIYPIEGRNSRGELVIRYVRTEQIEKRDVPVPDQPGYVYPWAQVEAKNRASCVIRPDDRWVLPYDLATEADITYYLGHRDARKDYLHMVPIMRAALAAKQAERDAEAPFRQLLAGTLAAEHSMDLAEVDALLPEVVDRWKLGNRHHRALTGDTTHEAKALKGVRAEFAATRHARHGDGNDTAMQVARGTFGDRLLAVLAKRDGTYLAVARSAAVNNPFGAGWVDAQTITKTGITRPVTEWTTVQARTLSRTVTVWADEAWAAWKQADPAINLTGPELAEGIERLRNAAARQHPDLVVPAITTELTRDGKPARTITAVLHSPGVYKQWPAGTFLRWSRTSGGTVVWQQGGRGGVSRYGGSVSVDGVEYKGDGCFPWVEESNSYYSDVFRSRLAWIDADVFRAWMVDVDAHEDERRREQEAAHKVRLARSEWADRHRPLFEAHLREQAHYVFVEEFGTTAEDLFEHWLKNTFRGDPVRRVVNDLTGGNAWPGIAGKTVAEVSHGDVSPLIAGYRFPPLGEQDPR